MEIQALFFRTDKWSEPDAHSWAEEHDFKHDVTRYREEDGEKTHILFPQFDPSEAKDGTFRTISDDFPEGISASVCERKSMSIKYTKGVQSADDPLEFVMSAETADRVGDIIKADGWNLKDFMKNPIALWGHSHSMPIGTWTDVRVEGKKLMGRLKLAAKGTSAEIDTIRSLLEQRILKAVSVGFSPIEYEEIKDKEGRFKGIKFLKQALHECSLVAVPCHQEALATGKSFGLSESETKRLLAEATDQGQEIAPTESVVTAKRKGTAVRPDARKLQRLIDKINITLGD